MMEDILKNPTFPEDELVKEKDLVKSALIEQVDDIYHVTSRMMKETLFLTHPYRLDVLGTKESVDKISREQK